MKVSDTYDIEVRNTIDRLLSIFTPVVTLLLAVIDWHDRSFCARGHTEYQ